VTRRDIPRQRSIVNRRSLAAAVEAAVAEHGAAKARPAILDHVRNALEAGREECARRLEAKPSAGHESTAAHAFLIDQIIRVLYDHVTRDLYPVTNPSSGEKLTILAVGGYGRAEMAPQSDVDLAFLTPAKRTAWCEQVVEALLYYLWDLGLKVGQSSRSLDEMVRMSREDVTIRTAMLEARYVWGDQDLNEQARQRFWGEVVAGTERQFVAEKLAERDARHKRMGDSRYVVEPNVKDGKGGLRDLQTLYWIGKYIHRVQSAAELVDHGLFTQSEYRAFRRADGFLLAVRCHMHEIAGRPEDRLTFDLQREVARRMNFADRPGKSAVERFMQFYFLQVKRVGSLTGVFLAQMDEQFAQRRPSGMLAAFRQKKRTLKGYTVHGGKIAAPGDDWFTRDPVRLIEIFQLAEEHGLEIDPRTMRMATRDVKAIDNAVREDPRANAIFLDLLTGRNNPEMVLRWMNETGVFGRFVPDFGRVNAQMQFDMYHHYTVDEHTIRAIGLTSRIERGELAKDHPHSTEVFPLVNSRRALYVAVLLHDIAKGRGGDHSELGAEIALELCPRFGLDQDETELVSWLVEQHLLMSRTAQKRDLADPKTVTDFVAEVQNLERLRTLMILTVVDIRAVGPGTWNDWKRQLIGELYLLSEERLRLGHKTRGRSEIVAQRREAALEEIEHRARDMDTIAALFPESYWIAEAEDVARCNLVQYRAAREKGDKLSIHTRFQEDRGATLVTVIADDHPGLFFRISGGIHLAGGNIIDARIHTTREGKAVDNFLVTDPLGKTFNEQSQMDRLKTSISDALMAKVALVPKLAKRPLARTRAGAFDVRPWVFIDNKASNRFTVIEVSARDRPALLNRLAHALYESNVLIRSAHLTHYGERAADTFYVTDLTGSKITSRERLDALRKALLDAGSDARQAEMEAA
jgi:[protein-PII] uridylyltransferase